MVPDGDLQHVERRNCVWCGSYTPGRIGEPRPILGTLLQQLGEERRSDELDVVILVTSGLTAAGHRGTLVEAHAGRKRAGAERRAGEAQSGSRGRAPDDTAQWFLPSRHSRASRGCLLAKDCRVGRQASCPAGGGPPPPSAAAVVAL